MRAIIEIPEKQISDLALIETFARSNFNPKNLQSRHPRESGDLSK